MIIPLIIFTSVMALLVKINNTADNYFFAKKVLKMLTDSDIGKAKSLSMTWLGVMWTTVYIQKDQPVGAHEGIVIDSLRVLDEALLNANTDGLINVKVDSYGMAEAKEPNRDAVDEYFVYVVKFIPIWHKLVRHLLYSLLTSITLTIIWYYFDIYGTISHILGTVWDKM